MVSPGCAASRPVVAPSPLKLAPPGGLSTPQAFRVWRFCRRKAVTFCAVPRLEPLLTRAPARACTRAHACARAHCARSHACTRAAVHPGTPRARDRGGVRGPTPRWKQQLSPGPAKPERRDPALGNHRDQRAVTWPATAWGGEARPHAKTPPRLHRPLLARARPHPARRERSSSAMRSRHFRTVQEAESRPAQEEGTETHRRGFLRLIRPARPSRFSSSVPAPGLARLNNTGEQCQVVRCGPLPR